MNILYLTTWFPFPPDNGSKMRAYYLLRGLAEAHSVTMVAFNPQPNTNVRAFDHVAIHQIGIDPFRYVQSAQLVKYLSPIPLCYWRIDEMEAVLDQLEDRRRWDAVVAIEIPTARYALRFSDTPRILDVDTSLSFQMRKRYQRQKSPVRRLRTWFSWVKAFQYERAVFRKFRVCTVASPDEEPNIQSMTGVKSMVALIPNGADCDHNKPGMAETEANTLVYSGALTYNANLDAMRYFLSDIYPMTKTQIPGVSLAITGAKKGVALQTLRLDESVRLTGYMDDIRYLVASSSVCVVPLRRGGGTRVKILEAMALGTPVVTTSKGVEGLDVIDGEHILVANTPQTFSEAVTRLLKNEELRTKLAAKARNFVEERYNWEHISMRFKSVVEGVIDNE